MTLDEAKALANGTPVIYFDKVYEFNYVTSKGQAVLLDDHENGGKDPFVVEVEKIKLASTPHAAPEPEPEPVAFPGAPSSQELTLRKVLGLVRSGKIRHMVVVAMMADDEDGNNDVKFWRDGVSNDFEEMGMLHYALQQRPTMGEMQTHEDDDE